MKNAVTTMFMESSEKVVLFIGGGGKSTLIHLLSKECGNAGQTTAILSASPSVIPMEANTLVTDSLKNFPDQLEQELRSAQVIYIGKKLSDEHLEPFAHAEIMQLIKSDLPVDRVFIEADAVNGRSVSGFTGSTSIYPANRYITVMGADAFNKEIDDNWLKSRDKFWQKKGILTPINLAEWIASREIFNKLNKKNIPSTFFLNKVENIFTQNLAHSFGKKIKQIGIDRVIIGSVFNSQFQIIE